VPAQVPEAPEFLKGYARAEWDRIVEELYRLGLLTIADIQPIAAYCATYDRWRTAGGVHLDRDRERGTRGIGIDCDAFHKTEIHRSIARRRCCYRAAAGAIADDWAAAMGAAG
jgi:phage terminase small subunit